MQCPAQKKEAYDRAFPNGPVSLASVQYDDVEGMEMIKGALSPTAMEEAYAEARVQFSFLSSLMQALLEANDNAKAEWLHNTAMEITQKKLGAIGQRAPVEAPAPPPPPKPIEVVPTTTCHRCVHLCVGDSLADTTCGLTKLKTSRRGTCDKWKGHSES